MKNIKILYFLYDKYLINENLRLKSSEQDLKYTKIPYYKKILFYVVNTFLKYHETNTKSTVFVLAYGVIMSIKHIQRLFYRHTEKMIDREDFGQKPYLGISKTPLALLLAKQCFFSLLILMSSTVKKYQPTCLIYK